MKQFGGEAFIIRLTDGLGPAESAAHRAAEFRFKPQKTLPLLV